MPSISNHFSIASSSFSILYVFSDIQYHAIDLDQIFLFDCQRHCQRHRHLRPQRSLVYYPKRILLRVAQFFNRAFSSYEMQRIFFILISLIYSL
jgi:hypothetical protein